MELSSFDKEKLIAELKFSASRSSGPGGQNVNKVNSRIELRFDIHNSEVLNPLQKNRLLQIAGKKVSGEGILIITAQDDRSQLKNKEYAMERLINLIREACILVKQRKKTHPGIGSIENRLNRKKHRSVIKSSRKLKHFSDE